jgi:hypothetical protein
MLEAIPERQCICFPPDEPPDLTLEAEIEAAKAVRCPIHGNRFSKLAPTIYIATQFRQPTHLHPERWKGASRQYVKAMEASFPPDRWPAQEIVDPDDGVRFVLKDGTEIHRIWPPPLVYDLDTGQPCGRLGRNGKILPLSQPTVGVECRDAKTGVNPAQTGNADVILHKEDDELLILDD